MSKTRRVVITKQIELPTPIQQVKLDSLHMRLHRAGRQVFLTDEAELPEFFARTDAYPIWVVVWKNFPEGIIYVNHDGVTLGSAAHKGLSELVQENAQAGGWHPSGPIDYYAVPTLEGQLPDREEVEKLYREYGWLD